MDMYLVLLGQMLTTQLVMPNALIASSNQIRTLSTLIPHGDNIHGYVGVGFRYQVQTERFYSLYQGKKTNERLDMELLTEDGKKLFSNTWVWFKKYLSLCVFLRNILDQVQVCV